MTAVPAPEGPWMPRCDSVFEGLLVAADLARLLTPGYPQIPNFAALDLWQRYRAAPRRSSSNAMLDPAASA